jgi:hypothetical protein
MQLGGDKWRKILKEKERQNGESEGIEGKARRMGG